nr:MAG TPA: hypothetical protein [Caudoviricetes sp.]
MLDSNSFQIRLCLLYKRQSNNRCLVFSKG